MLLSQNKAPSNPRKRAQILSQASDYMLLNTLLFKVIKDHVTQEYKLLLCIPSSKINALLHYFHTSLMGGLMGMTKTYMTIGQRFFCPNLAHHIRAYLIGCQVCQMVKAGKPIKCPFQKRININAPAMTCISMDIKRMPVDRSPHKYQYILVMLCEVSNFMVVIPLRAAQTKEICSGINKHFIHNYSPPTHLICDQASSFLSSLAQAFFHHYGIRLITVSPTNHKLLLAKHGIKSLAEILKCHLAKFGPHWSKFLDFAMLAYNSYNTPDLDGLSPFELVFGWKPNILPLQEAMPDAPISGTYREYYLNLREKLKYLRDHLVLFHDNRVKLQNRGKTQHGFVTGQVVYAYVPSGAAVQTGSMKVKVSWVGPLIICQCLSPSQFKLMTPEGKPFMGIFEETMVRPGWLRTPEGPVNTLAEYNRIVKPLLSSILVTGDPDPLPVE